jgi:hypothetical protein
MSSSYIGELPPPQCLFKVQVGTFVDPEFEPIALLSLYRYIWSLPISVHVRVLTTDQVPSHPFFDHA